MTSTARGVAVDRPVSVDEGLARLRRAIRSEFAVGVYRPDPNDPVLGSIPCEVDGCDLPRNGGRLCSGHDQQWRRQRQHPALVVFVQQASPLIGHGLPDPCCVDGCLGPAFRHGICNAHWQRYRKNATGDLDVWIASAIPEVRRQSSAECGYDHCRYPVRATGPWCDFHARRWEKAGKPDPDEWLASCRDYGQLQFRFTGLVEPLRSELQYVLQRRHDESRSKLRPWTVHQLAKIVTAEGASSLRDLEEHAVTGGRSGQTRALLRWSQDRLQQLETQSEAARGFDADIWNLRHLGCEPHASRGTVHVRFDGITQPWLRTVVKRWVRARLVAGLAGGTLQNHARHMTDFATWLRDQAPQVRGFADIDRPLLEDWLVASHLNARHKTQQRNAVISTLRSFLNDCRRYGWTPELPNAATLYRSDLAREPDLLPRALPEHVMRQLESEHALARVGDPTVETILRVLIDTGLRISHILRLPIDAVERDAVGHWCLRVLDTKVHREHVLPMTDTLSEHLLRQRETVRQRWPDRAQLVLFPRPTGNPDGQRPFAYGTFRDRLRDWLARCDVRDEHNQPVNVTAHQFRHTLGTRMINNGVPQHVVQEWLNHRSPQMTSHYARLHHETVRREWETYRERVNIDGDIVVLDPEAATTDAEWMKHNLHTAAETLPNGYCGRPIQRECEVPNACLTCPDFLTDQTFLPIHEGQREATAAMVDAAEQRGHRRMAETNRKVLISLDNVIAGLRRLDQD